MSRKRFLLQRGTNRFYVWTKELARRKDMVEVDAETIKTRIAAKQRELDHIKSMGSGEVDADIKEIQEGAKAIANLEAELEEAYRVIDDYKARENTEPGGEGEGKDETGEDDDAKILSEEEEKQKALMDAVETDPDILKIRDMKKKLDVADYMAVNFGVPVPDKKALDGMKLDTLINDACTRRTAIIEEQLNEGE